MFTGIVEEVGMIQGIGEGCLRVKARKVLAGLRQGDSVALNGACLTVAGFDGEGFTADVMPETFRRTTLGDLRYGSKVNLERALSLSDRLGGHIVSGHVDGIGRILTVQQEGNARLLHIGAASAILRYIIKKGSVALDGVSLTVVSVTGSNFIVSLIPHTRQVTTLHEKKAGEKINIENDVVGKYIEKFLLSNAGKEAAEPKEETVTYDFLMRCGF